MGSVWFLKSTQIIKNGTNDTRLLFSYFTLKKLDDDDDDDSPSDDGDDDGKCVCFILQFRDLLGMKVINDWVQEWCAWVACLKIQLIRYISLSEYLWL